MQYIGIDFGTSNSLACLVRNQKVEFLSFPNGQISCPTVLYFAGQGRQFSIGNEAIHQYLSHLEDNEAVGRLLLSIKTLLPEANFDYTNIHGFGRLTATDLVAHFLAEIKERVEKRFMQKFDGVVLGRPVNFSDLALDRLEKAAHAVGFKEVVFWLEPVAAALVHELTADSDELVCVIDLGGGTSDICIIETSPSRVLKANRDSDIKAVSGVTEAGDELNSKIMKHKIAPRFGDGSTFRSLGEELPFPTHLISKLSKWHRIHLLKNSQDIGTIISILPASDRPDDVERFLNLIKNHYGFELFRAIDASKKELSASQKTTIKFKPLELYEELTLEEFEAQIDPVVMKIENSILEAMRLAGIQASAVNRVVLTGGTSQIPLVERMVTRIFGEDKILRPDYFSSVASGLGHLASRL